MAPTSPLRRRAAREPLALILGWQEFWSLRFGVSPATLIPRADSETLIEAALALFRPGAGRPPILDLGTGTGCLLLAALTDSPGPGGRHGPRPAGRARLPRRTRRRSALAERAAFVCADWAAPLAAPVRPVLSNPPYIEPPTSPA